MIGVFLMLAQLVPLPAEPNPVPTSIAAIRSNPKKFDGQVVRLHGWVNSCQPLSCSISERSANASAGPGASMSIAGDKKFDGIVRPLVPTYVEVDARLDAACLTSSVCPQGAPMLTVVTLRGIVSPEPPPFEN